MLKYVYIVLISGAVSLVAFIAGGSNKISGQEQIIAMRRIGHKLLLKSGDSTSRVLPVKHTAGNEFEIRFEKPIALNPDALAEITTKEQEAGLLPANYSVSVHDCAKGAIQYAYSLPLKNGEAITCLGRPLPAGCYYVSITLTRSNPVAWLATGLFPMVLLLSYKQYTNKKKFLNDDVKETEAGFLKIGNATFYPALQKIKVDGEDVTLTGKETHVLHIFAKDINKEISRGRLQKEVWEDGGVIVGRSLDMFISKLRKKLKPEPRIQIVSIHGKGYKLIVE